MSKDIFVDVTRVNSNTPVYSNIHVQLDNASQNSVHELIAYQGIGYEGVGTIERFDGYFFSIYDIRQTDILIDRNNIDPVTNTYFRYRIISIPESFPDLHMEIWCDLLRGSA